MMAGLDADISAPGTCCWSKDTSRSSLTTSWYLGGLAISLATSPYIWLFLVMVVLMVGLASALCSQGDDGGYFMRFSSIV